MRIFNGDMTKLLPKWAAEGKKFDCVISDPPYHLASIAKRFGSMTAETKGVVAERTRAGSDGAARLAKGFMGATTDAGDISFQPETWKLCLDVLVPGGRMAIFGGTRTWWKTAAAIDAAGFEIEDTIMWVYGQGLVLRRSRLKPCYEPIILCRAPGRVLDLGIEECRVGGEGGRWPGNLCHDGSEEVLASLPDAPGQMADARTDGAVKTNHGIYGALRHRENEPSQDKRYTSDGATNFAAKPGARREDFGSAARFFNTCEFSEEEKRLLYHAKAPNAERVFRCGVCGEHAFRAGREQHRHERDTLEHLSAHATVKPLALMAHLVKLICPFGGHVLDPFAGTGSTIAAAKRVGRDATGIELDAAHAATAKLRVSKEKSLK